MEASFLSIMKTAYITGWVVAAPIGPVNLEIMRRVLRHGLAAGLLLGAGAVCIDAAYLTLFSTGLGTVLNHTIVQRILFAAGGTLLLYLGISALAEARRIERNPPRLETTDFAPAPPSAWKHYTVGLAMTAANPMTIAFWSALSLQFAGITVGQRLAASAALMAGCFSWVLAITCTIAFARRRVGPRMLAVATLIGGACVACFGIDFIARAVNLDALLARML